MVSALSAFPRRKHALIFFMALHWNLPSMSISYSERPDLCPAFQVWPHPFSLKRKGRVDLPNAAQDTTSPLCGTGTLLTHVQPDVHQDSQVLYDKAASSKLIRTNAWDLQNCCQELERQSCSYLPDGNERVHNFQVKEKKSISTTLLDTLWLW